MKKLLPVLFILASCITRKNTTQQTAVPDFVPSFAPGPSLIVYKTKADYSMYVPVTLSGDKKQIVSYPAPSDLSANNSLLTPTKLNENYFIDNKGINEYVAFLKVTYREYASWKEVPSADSLYSLIIDKDPIVEICDCGNKAAVTNPEATVNALIDSKTLNSKCRLLKSGFVHPRED